MPYTTKKGTGKDKGKTCVHKKSSKKKVGCTSGPIEKYLTALRMAESDDMDWMKGPPSFRFGEISRDLRNYFSKGDKVYLTGILSLSEGRDDKVLHLNHEPAIIEYIREDVGVLDLTLGENITSLPIWVSEMGSSYLDLGVFKEDDDMMITVPYKNINESDDLDWIRDTPSNQKVRPWNGNIGYPDADKTSPTYGKVYLYTDDEGVTREIKVGGLTSKHRTKNYKGEWFGSDGEVSFYDASIMSSDIESKNYDPEYPDPFEGKYRITMSRQEYNDNARKGKLILTPNNNSTSSINESEEDFDWASGFTWYKEMLDDMLSDCKTLKLANFNIRQNKPYMSAGGPSIMFLSRCKEWWDYFGGIPLTTSGRGPAEWFTKDNYDDGEYGVIWNPGWGRKKITPQLEDLEHDYTSAITTKWGDGIEKQLNGIHNGESWFVVDEDNRPVYDLIPEPAKGYAKIYEEEFFGDKLNESDDFGWAKEIPGTKEYGQRYRYFEIIACYDVYGAEECDDEYSHYIRIPSDEVDEIWDIPDGDFDYLAGPGDEAEGVIMYAIKNRLIPPGELNEIVMFQGVREIEKDGYEWESVNESKDFDWVKDIEPNWGTYYEAIMRDIEGLPKNLEDVTSEMLLPIWMKIHTINRQILTRDKQDIDGNVDKLFENMGRIEWMFERMMKLVDGETLLMYMVPHDYYKSKRLSIISHIKGMLSQLELLGESKDFDWIKDIEAKGFEKNKSYVVDVRHLKPYIPTSVSPTSEEYTKLTRTDVLDKLKRLGYNVDEISIDDADYLYIEPNDEAGYWDDSVWVNQTHWVDYDMEHNTPDLTYDGKYEIMDIDDLMFLLDNNMVNESTDFDWVKGTGLGKVDLRDCKPGDILVTRSGKTAEYVGPSDGYYDHEIKFEKNSYGTRTHDGYVFRKNRRDDDDDIIKVLGENKKSITEAAGISFEARKWGEIIYNEIMDNPNEKKRLIIDGYDHPEAFDGFPIDYVVIDFYDRLTGYGQEHSGYDKDGNYVVLLYIQPKLVQGQGGYDLRSVLNHEMKHAWEDYNRLSKGLPSVEQTKESQELYNRDFILMLSDQNIRGPIKEILKYYYYLSDLEKSAYLENVYDQNKVYERVLRDIAGKDFNEFKDRFDLDINWHLMNTAYDIPFLKKFKSPIDFIDYSAEELRSKALKMIKKVNKMKYIHKK